MDRLREIAACGHCARGGAGESCLSCRLLVCEDCALDWTTCREPVGRELRLGRTARLRDVDASGRYGVVSQWIGRMRLVDLRAGCWVEPGAQLPHYRTFLPTEAVTVPSPRLTTDGRLITLAFITIGDATIFEGLDVVDLETGATERVRLRSSIPADLNVSESGDLAWYRTREEKLMLVPLRGRPPVVVEPLPRQVIQAASLDEARQLVAAGTWGRACVYRYDLEDEAPEGSLDHRGDIRVDGDVLWVGIGAGRLAVLSGRPNLATLAVYALDDRASPREELYQARLEGVLPLADLSPRGNYIAIALANRDVALIDIHARATRYLQGLTDRPLLVRFAAGEHQLITADYDNRVHLRPHTGSGFADITAQPPLAYAPRPFLRPRKD